jgi:hypothetical protein
MFASLLLHAAILLTPAASAAQADLSIEALAVSESSSAITVIVSVENLGDATSEGVWVDLYGSMGSAWIYATQNTHYDAWLDSLAPGESAELEFVLVSKEWGSPYDGEVFVAVDVEGKLAEDDESNNLAALLMLESGGTSVGIPRAGKEIPRAGKEIPRAGKLALSQSSCGSSSTLYSPLASAPYMTLGFLKAHSSFLYCKSAGLN